MSSIGLRSWSTIRVPTPNGHYQIQLLLGDITALPPQDKVDIIMVSAFPGDYSPTPTSVIGALRRNLNIRVNDLARNKKEDLRRNFHCWLSHDLPPSQPYRRLLCFERSYRELSHPAVLVGDVFRALVPTFQNEEKTVITPILAAGDQSFDSSTMLKAMVDAAAHWMQAGLPLACLKIVVFTRNLDNPNPDPALFKAFEKLKKKWEASKSQWTDTSTIQYDVYLSYSFQDMMYVKKIEEQLKNEKEDIRIFSEKQSLNVNDAWQDSIFQVMIHCVRVVTVLTPHYLDSSECLEQYNIALCCNRLTKRDILAPFYVIQVPTLPTYMMLMQYIDFRTRTITVDGVTREEKFDDKLRPSCKKFINLLTNDQALERRTSDRFVSYDVFISYARKNVKEAEHFLNLLTRLNPNMKIFFDTKELRTGNSWQQSLYTAIDGSKVVVTLLSSHYLASQICREEYNLALIQHMMKRTEVIPVLIEDVTKTPRSLTYIPIINGTQRFESVAMKICKSIAAYQQFQKKLEVFSPTEAILDADRLLEQDREKFFAKHFTIKKNKICKIKPTCPQRGHMPKHMMEILGDPSELSLGKDVVFSFVKSDEKHAKYMSRYLLRRNPDLNVSMDAESEHAKMLSLENCRLVVVLLSPEYLRSGQGRDEFHMALCRQRTTKGQSVLYPVQVAGLLPKPSFPLLIPCHVSCQDSIWKTLQFCAEIGTSHHPGLPENDLTLRSILEKGTFTPNHSMWTEDMLAANEGSQISVMMLRTVLALTVACEDILDVLNAEGTGYSRNEIISNIMNLQNGWDIDDDVPFQSSFLKEISIPTLPSSDDNLADVNGCEDGSEGERKTVMKRSSTSNPDLKEAVLLEPKNESQNMSKAGDLHSDISSFVASDKSMQGSQTLTISDEDSVVTLRDGHILGVEGDTARLHYNPRKNSTSGKPQSAQGNSQKSPQKYQKDSKQSSRQSEAAGNLRGDSPGKMSPQKTRKPSKQDSHRRDSNVSQSCSLL